MNNKVSVRISPIFIFKSVLLFLVWAKNIWTPAKTESIRRLTRRNMQCQLTRWKRTRQKLQNNSFLERQTTNESWEIIRGWSGVVHLTVRPSERCRLCGSQKQISERYEWVEEWLGNNSSKGDEIWWWKRTNRNYNTEWNDNFSRVFFFFLSFLGRALFHCLWNIFWVIVYFFLMHMEENFLEMWITFSLNHSDIVDKFSPFTLDNYFIFAGVPSISIEHSTRILEKC